MGDCLVLFYDRHCMDVGTDMSFEGRRLSDPRICLLMMMMKKTIMMMCLTICRDGTGAAVLVADFYLRFFLGLI